jgi:hypothetical protein
MPDLTIRDVPAFRANVSKQLGVEDASETFVQVWPFVRQGLALLKQMAPTIPGVGVFVGFAVDIVIAAGDAAAKALGGDTVGRTT